MSTGCTRPRPVIRCHSRLTIVRGNRPFLLTVIKSASCSSRWFSGERTIDLANTGKHKLAGRHLPGRHIAAINLQRLFGRNRGQAIGVIQFPVIDKAVVAGRTFHVDAEEHLRDVLRKLKRLESGWRSPCPAT